MVPLAPRPAFQNDKAEVRQPAHSARLSAQALPYKQGRSGPLQAAQGQLTTVQTRKPGGFLLMQAAPLTATRLPMAPRQQVRRLPQRQA